MPVVVDMTIVAAVRRPSITARLEARTVVSGARVGVRWPASIVCSVLVPVAKGAIVLAFKQPVARLWTCYGRVTAAE